MSASRWVAAAVALCAGLVLAAPNPKLAQAKRQAEDLQLDAAQKSLVEALALPGNDRATLLDIFELQGIVYGTLGKTEKSRDAFRQLLVLDPTHAIAGDQPPRVRTPFYEAKEWATKNGPLKAEPGVKKDPTSLTITLTITGDVFSSTRAAVFHLKQGGQVRTETVKLDKGVASVTVPGERVDWWAEVSGDRQSTLLNVGSEAAPFEEGPKPVAVVQPPPPPPPPVIVAPPATSTAWMRPTGIGLGIAGVAAGVVGGVLGLQAQAARTQIANAERDPTTGVITGMTQRRAAELDATARSNGVAANVLFGAAAAAVATGVVLFVVGAPGERAPAVGVAASPGGVVVSGRF